MNIDEAVKILNARRHRDITWADSGDGLLYDSGTFDPYEYLTHFEAIAIAEKYEREAGK